MTTTTSNALSIAQSIVGPYFSNPESVQENKMSLYWSSPEPEDDEYEIKNKDLANQLLLQLVERCLKEDFPIGEYYINDIPYSDKEGWRFCFAHSGDCAKYKTNIIPVSQVRAIDFMSYYNGDVTPLKLVQQADKEYFDEPVLTCLEALVHWYE